MEDAFTTSVTHALPLAPREFANLGLNLLAYVRPTVVNGQKAFIISAADGTEITVLPGTREQVFATVRQNDIEPVSVH